MIKSDNMLLITISNEVEGCSMSIKTTETLGTDKVLLTVEPGVYKLEELKDAIKQVEAFNQSKQVTAEGKQDDGSTGYHLP